MKYLQGGDLDSMYQYVRNESEQLHLVQFHLLKQQGVWHPVLEARQHRHLGSDYRVVITETL